MENINRHALIIGINKYQYNDLSPLHTAVPGAERIAAALKAQHYHVTTLYDEAATTDNLVIQIHNFFNNKHPNATLLFYFAGHGFVHEKKDDDEVFLTSYNFHADIAQIGGNSGFPLSRLRETYFNNASSQDIFLILDCCYAGNFQNAQPGLSQEERLKSLIDKRLRPSEQSREAGYRALLAATGRYDLTSDLTLSGYSPLISNLLPVLEGAPEVVNQVTTEQGELTISSLHTYLEEQYQAGNAWLKKDYTFPIFSQARRMVLGNYTRLTKEMRTETAAQKILKSLVNRPSFMVKLGIILKDTELSTTDFNVALDYLCVSGYVSCDPARTWDAFMALTSEGRKYYQKSCF